MFPCLNNHEFSLSNISAAGAGVSLMVNFCRQGLVSKKNIFCCHPLKFKPVNLTGFSKSSYFSQFKPRNIIKTYPSKIIKSKLRKLEAREERKSQEP